MAKSMVPNPNKPVEPGKPAVKPALPTVKPAAPGLAVAAQARSKPRPVHSVRPAMPAKAQAPMRPMARPVAPMPHRQPAAPVQSSRPAPLQSRVTPGGAFNRGYTSQVTPGQWNVASPLKVR